MYKTASAFRQRLTRRGGAVSTPAMSRVNYMSSSGQTRLAQNLDRGAEARLAAERETFEANKGELKLIKRNSPEGRLLKQHRRRGSKASVAIVAAREQVVPRKVKRWRRKHGK